MARNPARQESKLSSYVEVGGAETCLQFEFANADGPVAGASGSMLFKASCPGVQGGTAMFFYPTNDCTGDSKVEVSTNIYAYQNLASYDGVLECVDLVDLGAQ